MLLCCARSRRGLDGIGKEVQKLGESWAVSPYEQVGESPAKKGVVPTSISGFVDAHLRASSPAESLIQVIKEKENEGVVGTITASNNALMTAKIVAQLSVSPFTVPLVLLAVVLAVTACVVWQEAVTDALLLFWSRCWSYNLQAAVACLGLTVVVLMGMIAPKNAGASWCSALAHGIKKTEFFMLRVVVPVGIYYTDLVTDVLALRAFWLGSYFEFFGLNSLGILLAAGYHAVLLRAVGGSTIENYGAAIIIMAFLQILPASCFLFSVLMFVVSSSLKDFALELKDCLALLSCSVLSEALLEALFGAVVQAYSLLHHDMNPIQERALQLSVVISILSLTKGFAEIDDKTRIFRYMDGLPLLRGSAAKSEPAFFAVVCYRMVSVTSRLLFIPFFQVLTHDIIQFEMTVGETLWHPSCGAFVLIAFDWLAQSVLIFWYTGSRWKIGWALANVISPVEPILHGGAHPIFTTKPIVVSAVHALETLLAGLLIMYKYGSTQGVFEALQGESDALLLKVCAGCCTVQLPLLLIVQCVFSYRVNPRDCWTEAPWYSNADMDWADKAVPPSMVVFAASDEITRYLGLRALSRITVKGMQAPALSVAMSANRQLHSALVAQGVPGTPVSVIVLGCGGFDGKQCGAAKRDLRLLGLNPG